MSEFADGVKQGLSFIVKNIAPQNKSIKVFNTSIGNGSALDLMQVPGISEDDIKTALLKGDLGRKLNINYLQIVKSTLKFDTSDLSLSNLLVSFGLLNSNWYLDPVNGSDNNSGASGSALKTVQELTRRLNAGMPRSLVTVNVLSNVTDANDYMALDVRLPSQGPVGPFFATAVPGTVGVSSSPVVLRMIGTRTTASFTDPNTASTTALTMTSNCLSPDTTQGTAGPSGPSGLPVILTVSGFDFTPHIGRNIEVLTSAQTNSVGAIATIVAAPSTGVAWLQPLGKLSGSTTNAVGATQVNTADYPQTGSTFRIYTCTTWAPPAHLGCVGPAGTTFLAVRDMEFTAVASGPVNIIRSQLMMFEGVTLKRPIFTGGGGEGSTINFYFSTSYVFPDPTGGRTPTQVQIVTGENRFGNCAFINCDYRLREGKASSHFSNCLFNKSCIMAGGPNDAGRMGPVALNMVIPPAVGLTIAGSDFGTGFFNWLAPDSLAPVGISRGSSGAAIHLGHHGRANLTTKLYGYNATTGTIGMLIQEGATVLVSEQCTYQSAPSNPGGVNPAYIPASLRLTGQAGDLKLDGYAAHMPDGYWQDFIVGARPAGTSNVITLNSWKTWEDAPFSRNAKGNKTGACVINMLV